MTRGPAWTVEQISALESLIEAGVSDRRIAQRLGRSENAVRIARKRHHIAPRQKALLSARTVAQRLGIGCAKTVVRWVQLGWLKGHRGQRAGPNRMWYITEDSLLRFLENRHFWHVWHPARIRDRDWRDWALEMRRSEPRLLTTRQVGDLLGYQHETVCSWIHKGLLPAAARNPNWLVDAAALEGFVPPLERSRVGVIARPFTRDEDAWLRLYVVKGWSWTDIGQALDRHPSVIQARWQRLQRGRAEAAS